MDPEISYFFAAASLAVHPPISVKKSLNLKGCKHIFSLLILLKPPRFNPIHVNLKITNHQSTFLAVPATIQLIVVGTPHSTLALHANYC
jgi:hypothetical protein